MAVVLDDPFDAEWAALATREKNPSPASGMENSNDWNRTEGGSENKNN